MLKVWVPAFTGVTGLVGVLFSAPALSADTGYFAGVYVREGNVPVVTEADKERLQLKCLIAPDVMGADGAGAGYFLDVERFRATRVVSYIKSEAYRCRYLAEKRMETCDSKELTDGRELSYYRTNIYQVFSAELQSGHTLFTPEEVANWNASGTLNPESRFAYHRCECITADAVETRAAQGINAKSVDETSRRRFWQNTDDPTEDDYRLAREIMGLVGKCNPKLS